MNVNYFYNFYQFDYVKEEIDINRKMYCISHPSCWGSNSIEHTNGGKCHTYRNDK